MFNILVLFQFDNFRIPDQIQTCLSKDADRNQKRRGSVICQHKHPPHRLHHPYGPLMHHGGPHVLTLQQQGTENTDENNL